MARHDGRTPGQLRPVTLETGFIRYPEGSVLINWGNTRVICNATVEESVPPFLKGRGQGWVTAEYNMLPRATQTRSPRDISKLKLNGRAAEIQRLIGRALRSVTDLEGLGERTITLDCDVIQADGGTRTASITGAFVALVEACASFYEKGKIFPVKDFLSAISVGVSHEGVPILDLCYEEDSRAIVDMNVVMTGAGRFVEVQGTGEGRPFTHEELGELLALGEKGCRELISYEKDVLGGELVWLVGREG